MLPELNLKCAGNVQDGAEQQWQATMGAGAGGRSCGESTLTAGSHAVLTAESHANASQALMYPKIDPNMQDGAERQWQVGSWSWR